MLPAWAGSNIFGREIARQDVAVATPLYAGPESKVTLFDGGLKLHVEGSAGKKAQRNTPWFDPSQPVRVRQVYLGSQKIESGVLPLETIIPTEDWILKLRFEKGATVSHLSGIAYFLSDKITLHQLSDQQLSEESTWWKDAMLLLMN